MRSHWRGIVVLGTLGIGCGGGGGKGGPGDAGPADGGATPDAANDEDAGPVHARPPAPGNMTAPDGSGVTSFVVQRWYLGGVDRDGAADPGAWQEYGYDIDGLISTPDSDDLCAPVSGGSPDAAYPDGRDGIDNSFGRNVLPILVGIDASVEATVNGALAVGETAPLLSLVQLGDGASYRPMLARAYATVDLGAAPRWDGTDAFDVDPAGLVNPPDLESARASYPGYLVDDTWVSGTPADFEITLTIGGGHLFHLRLSAAVVTMRLDAAHESADMGTVSGVVRTEDLVAELRAYAGGIDPGFCSGPAIDGIVTQVERASDILSDGTQDAGSPCDAISVGLGFDAVLALRSGVRTPPDPPIDPCL